jgi:hypothetical protein
MWELGCGFQNQVFLEKVGKAKFDAFEINEFGQPLLGSFWNASVGLAAYSKPI